MTDAVLDASAVLAWLQVEPGGEHVADHPERRLSAVNLAEVVAKLIDKGHTPDHALAVARRLALDIISFDEELALDAGALRARTRAHGLSLGDRACLALARRVGLPALTADRAWADVEAGVEIRMLR